jgi:hypothetical protein
MSHSYKILTAKRLGVNPAELLMYFETETFAVATTFDGRQHSFSKAELSRPADVRANPSVRPSPAKPKGKGNPK